MSFSLAGEDLEDFTGEYINGPHCSLVLAAAGINSKADFLKILESSLLQNHSFAVVFVYFFPQWFGTTFTYFDIFKKKSELNVGYLPKMIRCFLQIKVLFYLSGLGASYKTTADLCGSGSATLAVGERVFKGTVSRDFLLQVFFMNHLPPSP